MLKYLRYQAGKLLSDRWEKFFKPYLQLFHKFDIVSKKVLMYLGKEEMLSLYSVKGAVIKHRQLISHLSI